MGVTQPNMRLGVLTAVLLAATASGCAGTADLTLRDPGSLATAQSADTSSGDPSSKSTTPGGGGGGGSAKLSGVVGGSAKLAGDTTGNLVEGAGMLVTQVGEGLGNLPSPVFARVGGVLGNVGDGVTTLGFNLQEQGWTAVPAVGNRLAGTVETIDGAANGIVAVSALGVGGGNAPIGVNALSNTNLASGSGLGVSALPNGEVLALNANGASLLAVNTPVGAAPSVNVLGQPVTAPVSGLVNTVGSTVQTPNVQLPLLSSLFGH